MTLMRGHGYAGGGHILRGHGLADPIQTVADEAELLAAVIAAQPGEVITIDRAAQDLAIDIAGIAKTNVRITGQGGHSIESIAVDTCSGITFEGLNISFDNEFGPDYADPAQDVLARVVDSSNIHVENCTFDGGANEPVFTEMDVATYNRMLKRYRGLYMLDCTDCTATDNLFERLMDCCVPGRGNYDVKRNVFDQFLRDGVTGSSPEWDVDENEFKQRQGAAGRRHEGVITGTLVPDMLLTNGLSGDQEVVLRLYAVGPNYADGFYNNYAKPNVGDTLTDGNGNGITITKQTTDFDPFHGDNGQPTGNASNRSHQILWTRNLDLRQVAHEFDKVSLHQNGQFLLARADTAPSGHPDEGNPSRWPWRMHFANNGSLAGQPIGARIFGSQGLIENNFINSAEYPSWASDIRVEGSRHMTIRNNGGDNNAGGAIDLPATGQYANQSTITETNNLFIARDRATILDSYPDIFTYPQTKASYIPRVGGPADLAGVGPLDTDGNWRPLAPFVPVALPTVTEVGTPTFTNVSGAGPWTVSITRQSGANGMVVGVYLFDNPKELTDITATFEGRDIERHTLDVSDTSPAFDTAALFSGVLAEDGDVEVAIDTGSASSGIIVVQQLSGHSVAKDAASLGRSNNQAPDPMNIDLGVTQDDTYVFAMSCVSSSQATSDFNSGVTQTGLQINGGRTLHVGSATVDTSTLNIETNTVGSLRAIVAAVGCGPA